MRTPRFSALMVALVAASWYGCTQSPSVGQVQQAVSPPPDMPAPPPPPDMAWSPPPPPDMAMPGDGGPGCIEGMPCETYNSCRPGVCMGGVCTPGAPLPDGTPCDDASSCTQSDRCMAGVCAGTAFIDSTGKCQGRPPGVDWTLVFPSPPPGSAEANSVPVGGGGVPAAIAGMANLCPQLMPPNDANVFEAARAPRWIPDTVVRLMNPNPDRRSSFLYPQDWCFARADAMSYWVSNTAMLGKMFVFGNLNVATNNAPGGAVNWWYHVAPCYRDAMNTVMIIDPSLSPNAPLTAAAWVAMQTNPAMANVVICNTGAYVPASPCNAAAPAPANAWYNQFIVDQQNALNAEWINILGLMRNPQLELTTTPMGWLPAGGMP